ncbi:MAG: hypothetical protein R2705_19750 [Ilumatobacteraceae bacterium]
MHRERSAWVDWMGVAPFFAFPALFLLVPAVSVFLQALRHEDGSYGLTAFREAFSGQNRSAFVLDPLLGPGRFVGVAFGTPLAYAAAPLQRLRWLRSVISSFSGVAANFGGVPLAFAFLTLLGRQGVLTKIPSNVGPTCTSPASASTPFEVWSRSTPTSTSR